MFNEVVVEEVWILENVVGEMKAGWVSQSGGVECEGAIFFTLLSCCTLAT